MKKIITIFIIVHLYLIILDSQVKFQRAIGGTGRDIAYSITQTTDGGYAVAGFTNSYGAGGYDMYIVKINNSGTVQWSKTIGGTNDDYAYSITRTTDGGFVVGGSTASFGSGMYIVKLDPNGSPQWSKTVIGAYRPYSITQTIDGGYVLGGTTSADYCIVKLNSSGTLIWSTTLEGPLAQTIPYNSMIQTIDGGIAFAGFTNRYGVWYEDYYVMKINSSGIYQWSRTVGGGGFDRAFSIIQTTDSGFAMAGWSNTFGADIPNVYITKLNSNGTLQWGKIIVKYGEEGASSIIQTSDGGYVTAGYCINTSSDTNIYIVKLDGNANFQWGKSIGGTGGDFAYKVIETTDGGFAMAGYTKSFGAGNADMFIVKCDANGNTCGNSTSPSVYVSNVVGTLGTPSPIVTYPTFTINTSAPVINSGGIVTQICLAVNIRQNSEQVPSRTTLYQNYPNPFNPITKIKFDIPASPIPSKGGGQVVSLIIYDILGRKIASLLPPLGGGQEGLLSPGTYEVEFDGSNYPSGVYYYKLTAGEYSKARKLILLK